MILTQSSDKFKFFYETDNESKYLIVSFQSSGLQVSMVFRLRDKKCEVIMSVGLNDVAFFVIKTNLINHSR